eukprot:12006549-Heterocapsa_arctica.AAC.1
MISSGIIESFPHSRTAEGLARKPSGDDLGPFHAVPAGTVVQAGGLRPPEIPVERARGRGGNVAGPMEASSHLGCCVRETSHAAG